MKRQLVPDYIRDLIPYKAGKPIQELAKEKGLTRITKLASNENPLGPSPLAIREMTRGLWDVHRYPDPHAHELKEKLAQMYQLKKENIILGHGSESLIGHIARAFLQTGDEVLTAEKTFSAFFVLTKSSGAKVIKAPMKDHRYDVRALIQRITENTKLIYIANPDNPSGTYLKKAEFDDLMRAVPDHCLVILDEAYFEFAQEHEDYPDSMNYRYDNVITLRTFSKAYGLSGIRVGYGFAHEELIQNLHKVKLPFEPSIPGQLGALGALNDQEHLRRTLENNKKQYQHLTAYLKQKGFQYLPSATNFVAFACASAEASEWLFQNLLNQGVIVRPLTSNQMPEFLRVSLGSDEEMEHFYEAMEFLLSTYSHQFPMRS